MRQRFRTSFLYPTATTSRTNWAVESSPTKLLMWQQQRVLGILFGLGILLLFVYSNTIALLVSGHYYSHSRRTSNFRNYKNDGNNNRIIQRDDRTQQQEQEQQIQNLSVDTTFLRTEQELQQKQQQEQQQQHKAVRYGTKNINNKTIEIIPATVSSPTTIISNEQQEPRVKELIKDERTRTTTTTMKDKKVGNTNGKHNSDQNDKFLQRMNPTVAVTSDFRSMKNIKRGKENIPHRQFPHRPSLHVVGERHSGTNWLENELLDCFNGTVDFFRGYSTWKHWFQEENAFFDDSGAVVVAQFRNVYHWIKAMQKNAYHAPRHKGLDWHTFVTRPWTMPRRGQDLELFQKYSTAAATTTTNSNHNNKNHESFSGTTVVLNQTTCPHNLFCRRLSRKRPYEIIPCLTRFYNAIYELRDDGSGFPYSNVLELRAAKIRNFWSMAEFSNVVQFHPVRYETMVETNGREFSWLVQQLEQSFNVTAQCSSHSHIHGNHPQNQRNEQEQPQGDPENDDDDDDDDYDEHDDDDEEDNESDDGNGNWPPGYVSFLQTHVDWTTEALLGYTPQDTFGNYH